MPLASRQYATGERFHLDFWKPAAGWGCRWDQSLRAREGSTLRTADGGQGRVKVPWWARWVWIWHVETQVDRFRLRLANNTSILKILFSFQLPLYFGNSRWAWIKKKKILPNKGIIWKEVVLYWLLIKPPYNLKTSWACIRERSSSWKSVTSFYMNCAYYYLTHELNQGLTSCFSFK